MMKFTNGMSIKRIPPPRPADDLAPNVNVVDRDDAGPTGLAGFGKHFPQATIITDVNASPENPEQWPGRLSLRRGRVLDLCEQACGREENGLRNFDE